MQIYTYIYFLSVSTDYTHLNLFNRGQYQTQKKSVYLFLPMSS